MTVNAFFINIGDETACFEGFFSHDSIFDPSAKLILIGVGDVELDAE